MSISNQKKAHDYLFEIIVAVATVLAITIVVVLWTTFHAENLELWVADYGVLLSALGLLLASFLASASLMKSIENTKLIEKTKKDDEIYAQRLFFASTMRGISNISLHHSNLLDLQMENAPSFDVEGKLHVDLTGDTKYFLEEINNAFQDYIDILNHDTLPSVFHETKEDFTKSIHDLIDLKTEMYHVKPRFKALQNVDTEEMTFVRYVSSKLKEISEKALKLKNEIEQ